MRSFVSIFAVQLWTRSNYHWYLKQEYQFSSMGVHISEMLWDMEYPLRLHIVCNGNQSYHFFNSLLFHMNFSVISLEAAMGRLYVQKLREYSSLKLREKQPYRCEQTSRAYKVYVSFGPWEVTLNSL